MKSSFDLNAAIENWRTAFHGSAVGAGDVTELETHLHDSFAELHAHGFADEEAFHLACRRLGGTEVAEEFAKVNPDTVWAERTKWMLLGLLGFAVISGGLRTISTLIFAVLAYFDASSSLMVLSQWVASLLTFGLIAAGFLRLAIGKWHPALLSQISLFKNPAALAVAVCLFIFIERAAVIIRFRVGSQPVESHSRELMTAGYLNLGIAFITPVLLAVALGIAQRRVRLAA